MTLQLATIGSLIVLTVVLKAGHLVQGFLWQSVNWQFSRYEWSSGCVMTILVSFQSPGSSNTEWVCEQKLFETDWLTDPGREWMVGSWSADIRTGLLSSAPACHGCWPCLRTVWTVCHGATMSAPPTPPGCGHCPPLWPADCQHSLNNELGSPVDSLHQPTPGQHSTPSWDLMKSWTEHCPLLCRRGNFTSLK